MNHMDKAAAIFGLKLGEEFGIDFPFSKKKEPKGYIFTTHGIEILGTQRMILKPAIFMAIFAGDYDLILPKKGGKNGRKRTD